MTATVPDTVVLPPLPTETPTSPLVDVSGTQVTGAPSTVAASDVNTTMIADLTTVGSPVVTEAGASTAGSTGTPVVDSSGGNSIPISSEFVGTLDPPVESVGHSDGPATRVLQLRLLQLGFWNAGADGKYGLTTRQAVMAFQKYAGIEATGDVDGITANALSAAADRVRGAADTGTLIEIDKQRQLLFVVQDGKTLWALNTSTGNGQPYEQEDVNTPGSIVRGVALTPDGLWKVNRERPEGWWEGDLGQIYRPKYFRGGIAVHGSNTIPNYPASHGCVRVSVPAMDFIWAQNLMPLGTQVWVDDG